MKQFEKILVLENDWKEVPRQVTKYIERSLNTPHEIWFNFNYDLIGNYEAGIKRLVEESNKSYFVSAPSFVGSDNQFEKYLFIFYKLKELDASIHIDLLFFDGFISYLMDFLSDGYNYSKKQQNHAILKEILDFHTITEVHVRTFERTHITWDLLMSYYLETNKSNRDNVRIKATGEIYPVYCVYYNSYNDMDNSKVTLLIEDQPNNSYLLSEVEKIKQK